MKKLISIICCLLCLSCSSAIRESRIGALKNGLECNPSSVNIEAVGFELKTFGHFDPETGIIDVRIPCWIPNVFGLRERAADAIIRHECCHLQGIDQCRNPDLEERKKCLMHEDEDRLNELSVLPLQIFGGLKLCDHCLARLDAMKAGKTE